MVLESDGSPAIKIAITEGDHFDPSDGMQQT